MSLFHQRTLPYLDQLGGGYDAAVMKWRTNLEEAISSKVQTLLPINLF